MSNDSLLVRVVPMVKVIEEVKDIFLLRYDLQNHNLLTSLKFLTKYLASMRQDLHVMIEHPYVDKDYRDTYYHYFATKKSAYSKDSIRLSFFSAPVKEEDFRNPDQLSTIAENYRGFLAVRPTFPKVIGRSVVDPRAFGRTDLVICPSPFDVSANGLKLKVSGFPHSSQDGEATTCAETTVWSVLEYFGNKYPEYTPAFPSKVNQVLTRFSVERLLPSDGLTAGQISYALKEFGFGVKIYALEEQLNETNDEKQIRIREFHRTVRTYVESGIPVIGVLQNANIAHALSLIGRVASPTSAAYNALPETTYKNGVVVAEFADLDIDYVLVDDNHSPYQTAVLGELVKAYGADLRWQGVKMTHAIVPLHRKIYLEAKSARQQVLSFLTSDLKPIENSSILIRTFLMSSRSFKDGIASNPTMHHLSKQFLVHATMPKFVWVTEISDKSLIAKKQAHSLMVLDATEPKRPSIIGAMFNGRCFSQDLTSRKDIAIPSQPFTILESNLQ